MKRWTTATAEGMHPCGWLMLMLGKRPPCEGIRATLGLYVKRLPSA